MHCRRSLVSGEYQFVVGNQYLIHAWDWKEINELVIKISLVYHFQILLRLKWSML